MVTATNGVGQETAMTLVVISTGVRDHILIRDAPNGAGAEVNEHSIRVGQVLVLYAAAYDLAGNYTEDVPVLWDVTGDLDAVPSGPSVSFTSAPSTGNTSGTITADDQSGHTNVTGTITVILYRVFLPLVVRQ